MPKPVVAVVGRPNVGKSTLVNRIAVSRDAIVHESRGVTRDRSYHDADWNGRDFTLIDTGGIESVKSKDVFAPRIREQALMACEEADVIVFVVDGTTGVTDEDEEVARIVRRVEKPVFLVVNKKDDPSREQDGLWDFYSLGVGEPRPLSAGHGHGTGDLLDDIVAAFPEEVEEEPEEDILSLAIVGRPNVGKSSLANRLANKKRSIVSDVAGTTRDAIDTVIEWKGQPIKLVDTAGMRKKTQVHEDVEYYSLVRGLQAIDRADVCLLVVDATVGVTEQDQKVAGMAIDRGCALVLVLNKWDLVETEQQRDEIVASINKRLAFAPWIPTVNVSALTGRATDKVLALAVRAAEAHASQTRTSELNDLLAQIREGGHTRSEKGRRLKIQYATQTGSKPPVFTFWCNAPDLVDDNFERFLENRLRDRFDLTGTPVRLKFRRKSEGGDRA
ncbi:ribosome biogenesis GTPase Der [Thermophilibacter sp. ET337]|uniref:ribosome biogenesis GTPase Der n=1 Tax=Thermophilibacter sp. ET337 TaxID=2973084 RepID=UPI0021ABFAAD|nr:ribosome biogenesis GTPase Der [Thermophilibacter sp. ET337]MCR8908743.1 ribosome biogenesis GTPase Der [Thermophilibacter sp. ET337]